MASFKGHWTFTETRVRTANKAETEQIFGKTFGDTGQLKSGRSSRYGGTVHGARDSESLDKTISRPLVRSRVCDECYTEHGTRQTECY